MVAVGGCAVCGHGNLDADPDWCSAWTVIRSIVARLHRGYYLDT